MKLSAPAKINLHLHVGPRRPDGFHSLLSWMCTVALFDNLTIEPVEVGAAAGSEAVQLSCDFPGLATDQQNLVVRVSLGFLEAARASAHATAATGLRAALQKRIPMGAGLGGGSSDGARTIVGLNALFRTEWPSNQLSEFAARFGSDMPFFIYGPSSVCKGRGEHVRPISAPRPGWAVLLLPELMMPTPQVYRRFDEMKLGHDEAIEQEPDWDQWTGVSAMQLLPKLVNDLEAPAFSISKELGDLRSRAEAIAGRPVRMSGSGSSLFTLFDERGEAEEAAAKLTQELAVRATAVGLAPTLNDDLA